MNRRFTSGSLLAALVLTTSPWMPAHATENPYDSVGVSHNVYVACLMDNGGDDWAVLLRRVVDDCGFKPGIPTEDFVERYTRLIEADPSLSVSKRMQPYRTSYTKYQFSFFERIDQVLTVARNEREADKMLADLESEAVEHLSLRSEAEQSIFAALSTARHSLKYWSRESERQGGVTLTQGPKPWVKVLAVVGADLVGAGLGTLIGGPLVGGPVGAASSAGTATVLKD